MDNQSKKKILIIDDAQENINLLTRILEQEYLIEHALNGREGLAKAAVRPAPDLILLDIKMPIMDGYEVIENLKSSPDTSLNHTGFRCVKSK